VAPSVAQKHLAGAMIVKLLEYDLSFIRQMSVTFRRGAKQSGFGK
jgi:hypothetical protein